MSSLNGVCGIGDHGIADSVSDFEGATGEPLTSTHDKAFDEHFILLDSNSRQPLPHVSYRMTLNDGQVVEGQTDALGRTQLMASDEPRVVTLSLVLPDAFRPD